MTVSAVIDALDLPPESRVDQRVPKKLLVENGAQTSGDKRQINEGIEELMWVAALKPTTIGVPEYRDEIREYLEISVLSLALRPKGTERRLAELIHRAIPYPVLLLTSTSDTVTLSMAHKRWSQNEAGKTVLEGDVTRCSLVEDEAVPAFLESLSLTAQPRTHLLLLYQGWINCVEAFQAAQITGRFAPAQGEGASARSIALVEYDRITRQVASLRAHAARESQINRRVEMNLEIRRLETDLSKVKGQL